MLVTTQGTGSGGSAWTVKFIGLGRLQRQDRTSTFTTEQTATSDDRRKEFSRDLQDRPGRACAEHGGIAPRLDLTWTKPAETTAAVRDRWNSWVFRVNLNGNFNGERRSTSASSRISFSSSRTTEDWKLNVSVGGNISKETFEVEADRTVRSQRDNWFTEGLIVRSHGPRTSSGFRRHLARQLFEQ